jgi:predicted enzyme related to lactoylglutathione lyase
MKTLTVVHVLFVKDMERAIAFYEKAFDFKVRSKSTFWSNIGCGHGFLGLTTFGNRTELKETMLVLEVDDHLQA